MTADSVPTIDEATALSLLQRVVEEKGADYTNPLDYVYPTYVRDGEGWCFVGHALLLHGRRPEEFQDRINPWGHFQVAINDVNAMDLPDEWATPGARRIFQVAQDHQDFLFTWGECLRSVQEFHGDTIVAGLPPEPIHAVDYVDRRPK